MANVEHLWVDVFPKLAELGHVAQFAVGVGRGTRGQDAHAAAAFGRLGKFVNGCGLAGARPSRRQVVLCDLVPFSGVHEPVHDRQAGHGVLAIHDDALVAGRDAGAGKLVAEGGAADEQGDGDPRLFQVACGDDHLLGAFHEQAGQADGVGLVLAVGLDQVLGRDFDAEIDDVEPVVRENDFHQVFADVVHVALDGGEQDLALRRVGFLLHELFEVRDRRLHGLGALQHLGDDEFVGVEQPADLLHAVHERAVDDVERPGFLELQIQVVDETVLRAFEDVIREATVERQVRRFLFYPALGGAEMLVDGGDVVLVDRGALFTGLLAVIIRRIEAGERQIPQ